jgi:hypothetical protein
VVEGGDPLENCTELDIILIPDKCMYLVAALDNALLSYPKRNWQQCCEEACNTCKVFLTPHKARAVQNRWQEF